MEILSNDFKTDLKNMVIAEVKKIASDIKETLTEQNRYLNKSNACKYADISHATLDKWISMGLPISKVDGCFRIDKHDIDEFLYQRKT